MLQQNVSSESFFFTIADNLSDVNSGIVEILFKASSLLNSKLIDEAEKLTENEKWISILKTMEIHNFEILPEKLNNYKKLPADERTRLAFLARMARERIIFNNEKWHFIHENEISIAEKNNLIIEKQTLQAKLDNSEVINSELIAKNKTLLYKLTESENNNIAFQNEISNLRSQLNKVNSDVAIIQKSISYKLGLILTWIPRKIKEILSLAKIRRDKKL